MVINYVVFKRFFFFLNKLFFITKALINIRTNSFFCKNDFIFDIIHSYMNNKALFQLSFPFKSITFQILYKKAKTPKKLDLASLPEATDVKILQLQSIIWGISR